MTDEKRELRRAKIREARKNLKEVKREVTCPHRGTYLKSFYGTTHEEALQAWRDFVNPPLRQTVPVGGAAAAVRENTVPWWYLHKYKPSKSQLRRNSRLTTQHAASHLLPELWDVMIWELKADVLNAALARIAEKKTVRNQRAKPKAVREKDGSVTMVEPTPRYEQLSASLVNKCRRLGLELNEYAYEELGDASADRRVKKINPKRVPVRKECKRDATILTPPMIRLLIEASAGHTCYVPVILCGFLGLRINEALGLNTEELLPEGILRVAYQATDGGGRTPELKTDSSRRDLPIPKEIADMLRPFAVGRGLRLARGIADNNPLNERNVNRGIAEACARAGLPKVTAHELRHAFATWLDENGCPRAARFELLGHSTHELGERYVHPSMAAKRRWVHLLYKAAQKPHVAALAEPVVKKRTGTRTPRKGETNGRSVLTEQMVREVIRPRLALGESPSRIAKSLPVKVDPAAIRAIAKGKTWRHAV
jgi:integrase